MPFRYVVESGYAYPSALLWADLANKCSVHVKKSHPCSSLYARRPREERKPWTHVVVDRFQVTRRPEAGWVGVPCRVAGVPWPELTARETAAAMRWGLSRSKHSSML